MHNDRRLDKDAILHREVLGEITSSVSVSFLLGCSAVTCEISVLEGIQQ